MYDCKIRAYIKHYNVQLPIKLYIVERLVSMRCFFFFQTANNICIYMFKKKKKKSQNRFSLCHCVYTLCI